MSKPIAYIAFISVLLTLSANPAVGITIKQARQACRNDIERLCPGVARRDVKNCLRDNRNRLSNPCENALIDLQNDRPGKGNRRSEDLDFDKIDDNLFLENF